MRERILAEARGNPLALLARGFNLPLEGRSDDVIVSTVDAYWIAKHRAEAQRLGVLHFRHTRLLVAEHWNEHERRDGDPALPLFARTSTTAPTWRDSSASRRSATGRARVCPSGSPPSRTAFRRH